MKLTELKCAACNGSLKLDENNPHIAVCEYCRTHYMLEDEGEGNVRLAGEPPKINYIPIAPAQADRPTGWRAYGQMLAAAGAALVCLIVAALAGLAVETRLETDHAQAVKVESALAQGEEDGPDGEGTAQVEAELTGVLGDMAAIALGKPAGLLTQEELGRFQWVEYKYSMDHVLVGYSFDNPLEDPDAALTWLEFDRDRAVIDNRALSRFTGLKALSAAGYLNAEDVRGLGLVRLGCYGKSPGEVAALFEDPARLKELHISAGLESLNGLEELAGLKKLALSRAAPDGYKGPGSHEGAGVPEPGELR